MSGWRNDWRVVGDRNTGGEVAHGMQVTRTGRRVMQVSVPFGNADLNPADAYRLASGILEQLRDAGYLDQAGESPGRGNPTHRYPS